MRFGGDDSEGASKDVCAAAESGVWCTRLKKKRLEGVSGYLNNLGNVLRDLRDYDSSISCFDLSLEIQYILFGRSIPNAKIATTLSNLGTVFERMGDDDRVDKSFDEISIIIYIVMGSNLSTPDHIEDCDEIQDWLENPNDFDKQKIAYIKRDHIMYGRYNTDNIINYAIKINGIMTIEKLKNKKKDSFLKKIQNILDKEDFPDINIKDMWKEFRIKEEDYNITNGYVIINKKWNNIDSMLIDEFFNNCTKHELDTIGW